MAVLKNESVPSWIPIPKISSLKTRGNGGEKPTWFTNIKITPSQVKAIRAKHLTAAFINWSTGAYNEAVQHGLEDSLKALGIKLVTTANNNFSETLLQQDVKNIMPLKPNILFYNGQDPTADKASLAPAVKAGVAIVGFANAPGGWTTGHPKNFVTQISYPTYRMGAELADRVHQLYPNGVNLAMIYYNANYQLVNQREQGFEDELKKYPNIKVVTRQPMSDPSQTAPIATAIMARYPQTQVIFAGWDSPPATGVIAGLHSLGAAGANVKIVTMDMGVAGIQSIACGGPIVAETLEYTYQWGRTAAIAAALHELGVSVPPYVVVPTGVITKTNAQQAWKTGYGPEVPFPSAAKKCLGG